MPRLYTKLQAVALLATITTAAPADEHGRPLGCDQHDQLMTPYGQSYVIVKERKTFLQAKQYCANLGGIIATVNILHEKELLPMHGSRHWVNRRSQVCEDQPDASDSSTESSSNASSRKSSKSNKSTNKSQKSQKSQKSKKSHKSHKRRLRSAIPFRRARGTPRTNKHSSRKVSFVEGKARKLTKYPSDESDGSKCCAYDPIAGTFDSTAACHTPEYFVCEFQCHDASGSTPVTTTPPTNTTKQCTGESCADGECRSMYGQCGSTAKHCDTHAIWRPTCVQCTGEPCPESKCRSKYETCGHGSEFCNELSLWEPSCPPQPVVDPAIIDFKFVIENADPPGEPCSTYHDCGAETNSSAGVLCWTERGFDMCERRACTPCPTW
jgi:hypothetical protein